VHKLVTVRYYVPIESTNGVGVAGRQPIGLLLRQVSDDLLQEIEGKAQRILDQIDGIPVLLLSVETLNYQTILCSWCQGGSVGGRLCPPTPRSAVL
jgi:hypothetical protein